MGELSPAFPDTHYLVTKAYGWFDRTHFDTGNPEQVLLDVRTAVAKGGGVVTIRQGVLNDITGYTARYYVSGRLAEAEITAAALGIYLDWSKRFEAWQAYPPHGLAGPLTSFAVEDLPSQYLGFYAQTHRMSVEDIFACYLGPVSGSGEGPPDFVMAEETVEIDGWAGIARLQNRTFTPMVKTEEDWQYVDWPKPMQMKTIANSPDTWQFLSETTWYWDDATKDLRSSNVTRHSFRPRRVE